MIPSSDQDRRVDASTSDEVDIDAMCLTGYTASAFTENRGQWDDELFFVGSTSFGRIGICSNSIQFDVAMDDDTGYILKYLFPDSNQVVPVGDEMVEFGTNYMIGSNPEEWMIDVPSYNEVYLIDLWDGIDLRFLTESSYLKYEFILHPGADPERIAIEVEGHESLAIRDGNIHVKIPGGISISDEDLLTFYKDGGQENIGSSFNILSDDTYSFDIDGYDISRTIVIDPLIYSTFIGGTTWDRGFDIDIDDSGNAYLTGFVSTAFPTTAGAYDTSQNGARDVAVSKLNSAGSTLLYSTYIGGSGNDYGYGIAVDSSGNAYITGQTASSGFPTTTGANDTTLGGSYDAFICVLNPTGSSLLYSSFIGGSSSETGYGAALDESGYIYLTGVTYSTDFYTTSGSFNTSYSGFGDCYIMKANTSTAVIEYSTLVGGNDTDLPRRIIADSDGNAFVVGNTGSEDFPTTSGANSTVFGGSNYDGFIFKLNSSGARILYSTYLGGDGNDYIYGISLDENNNATVAGATSSTDFPTTAGAYSEKASGSNDAFVTMLNQTGGLLSFSTLIGGTGSDTAEDIILDDSGNIWVAGSTKSTDFPMAGKSDDTTQNGNTDAIVFKMNSTGDSLIFSTYLGGSSWDIAEAIDIDDDGFAYITGRVDSTSYPTTTGAYSTTHAGWEDWYVTKISADSPPSEPIGLDATLMIDGIILNWTTPSSDGGSPITGYNIYRGTTLGNIKKLYSGITGNSFADMNVTLGTIYYYYITALNVIGESDNSKAIMVEDSIKPIFGEDFSDIEGTTGDMVNLSIEVDDDLKLVSVEAFYRHTSSFISVEMTTDDEEVWDAIIPAVHNLEPLTYYFTAEDAYGNTNSTDQIHVEITDNDNPTFLNDKSDTAPSTGDLFRFEIEADDNIMIDEAYVNYRFGEADDIIEVMKTTFADHWWFSIKLPYVTDDPLYYHFSLNDTSDNWNTTEEVMVPIIDNDRPIYSESTFNETGSTGDKFMVSIEIGDNMDLQHVYLEYWFKGGEHQNISLQGEQLFTYDIQIPSESLDDLNFKFYALDVNGNGNETRIWTIDIIDDDLPTIIEDLSSESANTGEEVKLSVKAVDNIKVEETYVEYWFGNGNHINRTLKMEGDNEYQRIVTIPGNSLDPLFYIYSVVDSSGNWISGEINEISVIDNLVPAMNFSETADVCMNSEIFHFAFEIWDNVEIAEIIIEYWIGDGDHLNVNPVLVDGLYGYDITIPNDSAGFLSYKLIITDSSGNSFETVVEDVDIQDGIPPEISIVSDIDVYAGDNIRIELTVSDNIGIEEIRWIDLPFEGSGNFVEGKIEDVGEYHVIVRVFDASNNFREIFFNITAIPRPLDMDEDGIPDEYEAENGLSSEDPSDAGLDPDEDGLTNLEEFRNGTKMNDSDTDDDGLLDGFEVDSGTDPLVFDVIETDDEDDEDGIHPGIIIGVVIVIILLLGAVIAVVILVLKKKSTSNSSDENAGAENNKLNYSGSGLTACDNVDINNLDNTIINDSNQG